MLLCAALACQTVPATPAPSVALALGASTSAQPLLADAIAAYRTGAEGGRVTFAPEYANAQLIVAGLRGALVQTTAGAIIAGLVGGGGLGTFVFLGASETATDLILLGVLPIMALALFFDRTVLALQRALQPWDRPR